MIASSDVPSPAILLFRFEGDELALKESFPVEESVFNIARSGDGTTAAVQVRTKEALEIFNTDLIGYKLQLKTSINTPFTYDRRQRVVDWL